MDKLASMRAFTEVVNHSGFAAAGRHMGLTRSVVNKLVLQLESELGVQLLQRTTRRVSPTDAGRAYYERCLTILADVDEAEQAIAQHQAEPKGTLRINAPMSFGTLHLAPAIAAFMAQYPALQVQLTLSDRFVDLLEEGFDLTFRIAVPKDNESLITHAIAPIRRVLCAAPSYLKARGIPQTPADLHDHDCLQYGYLASGSQWRLTDPTGKTHTLTIRGRYCANNGQVLAQAAIQGLGIAYQPTFIVGPALRSGALEEVLPHYSSPTLSASISYLTNRQVSTKIQLLVAFLSDWFAQPSWEQGTSMS